ncbi:MAG: PAS domain S-box protein [Candidatus Kapabacteria bacterium]|nr:PAS domain S-box protein [Ignavibacteriota bacterium]MCW5884154.1 PAS domain S-box protein [Candidatus Kapabacteria bacterium]
MLKIELIYNLSFLIALSVISGFINNKFSGKSIQGKVYQGLLFGLAAVLGMMYPFVLVEGLIFDGRSVLLSVSGIFFGPIPAVIAGAISASYRLFIGGSGAIMGVLVIIESVLIGILFYYFRKKSNSDISIPILTALGLTVHIIMLGFMMFLPSNLRIITFENLALSVLTIYPVATILMGKILDNNIKNKQLIRDLSLSENKLKKYFDSSPDSIFVADRNGNYVDANIAAEKLTGFTREEILKMNILDFSPIHTKSEYKKHFKEVTDTEKALGYKEYVKKDGTLGWWIVDAVKISDDRYIGFSRDITEKIKSEQLLKESLDKFSTLFELAPDSMLMISIEENIYVDVNNMFEKMFQYSKEEIIGKSADDYLIWSNQDAYNKAIALLYNNRTIKNFETEMQSKYGNLFEVLVSGNILSLNGKMYIFFIFTDITEKKAFQKIIAESEEKFRRLVESMPDGFYRSTPDGKFLYVNPAMVSILGYDSAEELMNIEIVRDLYFSPEEREPMYKPVGIPDSDYEIYRLRKKDGSTVWIEDHSRYNLGFNNQIQFHEGICRDITARVKAESENIELVERIKKVSAHLPGFIYQFDLKPDGSFSFPFASDGVIDIYGFSPEEVKKDATVVLKSIHLDDVDRIMKSIYKSAEDLSIWHEIYRTNLPDGRRIWVEGYSSPEKLEDGTVLWHGFISDITDRKMNEDKIIEREFSLNFAQGIAKMGSWELNLVDRTMLWSKNYYKLLGYEDDNFKPDNSHFLRRIHPDDYLFVKSAIELFYQNPAKDTFEFRIVLPDNQIRWIQNSYIPVFENDEIVSIKGVNIDITERKLFELNLKKLNRAIEQSPLSVVITNLEGDIEYVNPMFSELTGYSFDEVIGQNPRILKSDKMPEEMYLNMWNTLLKGNVWQGEILNKKKSGELYWEDVKIAPVINEEGITSHYIAIKADISESKRMNEDLISAKEKAEESDRLKSAFIANLSHEIRTPLNGIIGFSRLLGFESVTDEERVEYSQILNSSCNRLLNTVNDILDISKIEANQMDISKSYFSLKTLLMELYNSYKSKFDENSIELILDIEDEISNCEFYSDEQKVYQILNNLISNSLKFTKEGQVTIGARKTGDDLEVYVFDTGIGISKKNQEFIFGRFNQENNDYNSGFEGTGLGLAICKGLTELLGGSIRLESNLNEGSKFYLYLPFMSKNSELQ